MARGRDRGLAPLGGFAAALIAGLLAGACAADADAPPTAPPTAPPATTATSATTTTVTALAATTSALEPPPGKDLACLKRAHFGDPAESEYILPYPVSEAYYLMQSYCATEPFGSHRDQLAYDWYMPIGSEVVASRGGWVVEMRESNPDSGLGHAAENFVYIEHADGTVAFYAHLMQHAVDVDVGQWVDQGERIGASGNSGSTGGLPHLHFGVYRAMPQYEEMGVAVGLRNAEGPLDTLGGLLVNRLYTALPWEE